MRRVIPTFVLLCLAGLAGCPKPAEQPAAPSAAKPAPPRPSDRSLVEAFRTGKPTPETPAAFVEAARQLAESQAGLEFDDAGRLVGVDLATGRKSASKADLQALRFFTRLKRIDVAGDAITNARVMCLATITSLTDLALRRTQIDNRGLAQLAPLINLTSLNLQQNVQLTDAGLEHLRPLARLTALMLPENGFTDAAVPHLLRLPALKLLDLRDCPQITDAGLEQLQGLKSLKTLKLGGYSVTDATLQRVKGFPRLTGLAVEACGITNDGLAQLEDLPLEDLTLFRCNSTDDDGFRHFTKFRLRQLSLRDMPIRGNGLAYLADKKSLKVLLLNQASFNDEGASQLPAFENLTRLELQQTPITDAALPPIGRLTHLEVLDLAQNTLTDAGVAALAGLARLKTLDLSSNSGLTDASIEDLVKLAGLTSLNVSQTAISSAGLERLRKALPTCQVIGDAQR